MRINYYNFIRVNQATEQNTSSSAGINLNLGENKVESLMRQAVVYSKDIQQEPVVKGLVARTNKVQLLNEGVPINVK
ncbi:MAG TPA: hypothetical protein VF172_12635 [Nitrososphaera sp.]|jgi:hypothetical protein